MSMLLITIFGITTIPTVSIAKTRLALLSWVPLTNFIVKDILVPWVNNIEKVTEGRVAIKILPKPVGSPLQHFELARKGVADIIKELRIVCGLVFSEVDSAKDHII